MKQFIKSNIVLTSIIIFLFLFMIIVITKPKIIYNKDGTFRNFGIGYTKKTVIPIWLIVIVLSILSYFFVNYYIVSNKIQL